MWKGIRTLPPRSTKRMGQLVYSLPAVAPVVDPSLNGFIRHQQKYITSNARILSPTCSFSSRTRDFRESNCNSKRVMAPLWPLSTGLNIRGGGMLQNPLASISTSTRSEFTSVDTSEESILLQPITRITTKSDAQHALKVLFAHKDVFWACDTEVADIDLKVEGPVGHGKVTCISIYGGENVDFGLGEGKGSVLWIENINDSAGLLNDFKEWFENPAYKKVWHNYGFDRHVMYNEGIDCQGFAGDTMHMARLWDTSLDKMEGAGGYSLASLTSLLLEQSNLASQTQNGSKSKYANSMPSEAYMNGNRGPKKAKESMMDLFGVAKLTKSGQPSKVKILPSVWELQTDPLHRNKWIQYSAKDAVCTFDIHKKLMDALTNMKWDVETVESIDGEDKIKVVQQGNMYDFYEGYLRAFGEVLTDMERIGIKVDVSGHLKRAEKQAREDKEKMEKLFVEWMSRYIKDAKYVNIGSTAQMQQLFFGHYKDRILLDKSRLFTVEKDETQLEAETAAIEEQNKYATWKVADLREELKSRGLKRAGNKTVLVERLLENDNGGRSPALHVGKSNPPPESAIMTIPHAMQSLHELSVEDLRDICIARNVSHDTKVSSPSDQKKYLISLIESDHRKFCGESDAGEAAHSPAFIQSKTDNIDSTGNDQDEMKDGDASRAKTVTEIAHLQTPKRNLEFTIESFGMKPTQFTPAGVPQVSNAVLRELSGKSDFTDDDEDLKESDFGLAYKHFGGGQNGKDACKAIGALANISQVDTMITSFLLPLQALADDNGRIHCSLNLNTETGRLSSRKPNLQNQPALEKDKYKIRDAFVAEEGNTLLVADYGQLELRLMAHMTQCRSMLNAFESGGCFHSRTAAGMYPYIQEAIDRGDVLLEWDYSKGDAPKPLVKDIYGSERRKAKTLNFSIAYGKTIHGLAKDWGISLDEAKETLEAWYRDRPEVRQWQEETREMAKRDGYVRTIMGRRRNLKDANSYGAAGSHALRAAINTPIQGSAADVVMMAMIKLWKSQELKRIGWNLLLQIHDEVILEGPRDSKDLAMAEVLKCMQNPFDGLGLTPLSVKLEVDAKTADTWYEAK